MNGDITFHSDKKVSGEDIDGIWWMDGDHGSWDGPHIDWLSHREKILGRVKEFGVVVQAGGNLGLYPRLLAQRFERVYTFEPHPKSFRCMMKNVEDLENVFPINAALAQHNELCAMSLDFDSNMGTNRTVFGDTNYIKPTVPTFTVDQLKLDRCDLIWFDIEGAEPGAVEGSIETITKFRPVVALETTDGFIQELLGNLGYDTVDRSISDNVYAIKS